MKLSHARYITNIGTHLVVSYRAVATDARRSDDARRIERDVLVSANIVVKVAKMVGGPSSLQVSHIIRPRLLHPKCASYDVIILNSSYFPRFWSSVLPGVGAKHTCWKCRVAVGSVCRSVCFLGRSTLTERLIRRIERRMEARFRTHGTQVRISGVKTKIENYCGSSLHH